jgi:hypothetical protein
VNKVVGMDVITGIVGVSVSVGIIVGGVISFGRSEIVGCVISVRNIFVHASICWIGVHRYRTSLHVY